MSALIWEPGQYAGMAGYLPINGEKRIRIASISWSTKRGDPEPWVLTTALPGFAGKDWHFVSPDEAQVKADRLLMSFAAWISAAVTSTQQAEVES